MTTGKTPEDLKASCEMIKGFAREMNRTLGDDFEVALYYNINVNEDRDAAFAESKKFLDSYYTTSYNAAFLNNWVAMGSPEECIRNIRAFADAGATTITLRLTGYDQKKQFKRVTEEVLPAFASKTIPPRESGGSAHKYAGAVPAVAQCPAGSITSSCAREFGRRSGEFSHEISASSLPVTTSVGHLISGRRSYAS